MILIGLGSNRGDSRRIVVEAMARLAEFAEDEVRCSGLWRTSPVDCPPGSSDFINAAAAFTASADLTPEARQRFRIGKETEGVLVAGVQQGSPAAKAGIEAGQVINMVGQEPVHTPQDVITRVQQAAAEDKSSVLLMLVHEGQQRFVAVKFARA